MKIFKRENIVLDNTWNLYKKKRHTFAKRINGHFTVQTREGTLTCKDGYLALDSECHPYPIAKKEFKKIYIPIKKEAIRGYGD